MSLPPPDSFETASTTSSAHEPAVTADPDAGVPSAPPAADSVPAATPPSESIAAEGTVPPLEAYAEMTAAVQDGQVLDGISGEQIEALLKQETAGRADKASHVHAGRITNVVGEDVFVDIDDQSKGIVPLIEFSKEAPPVVGAEIHVVYEQYNPSGVSLLSKRKADRELTWLRLRRGAVVEGRVTAMNKGGLEVDLGGVRAFLPASQCDLYRMKDISVLLNLTIKCEIVEMNRGRGEVIVSRRHALIREREETRKRVLDELREGEIRRGVVGNLTDYGAFVNLGGVDGLLHISDMSWGHITRPSQAVRTGQEIDVLVLKVDRAKGKVSLGLKQLKPDPWQTADTRYAVGTRLQCRVVRLADFGAFVELEEGLEGLVPLTEMSWVKRVHRPSEVVQEGAVIDVVVLSVDKDKRRISLSMKQIEADPWASVAERYPKNATVPGKVARLTEFGAFVELQPGVDGLIHISELSDRRINSPEDAVKIGQDVQVRVLAVDAEKRRISLSLRPPRPEPAPSGAKSEPSEKAQPAKRKKPLRGGLTSHWDWASTSGLKLKG